MSTTTKTNPAYAALAYRRTILNDVIFYLKRRYVGMDGDPQAKLVCEDVFYSDSQVPIAELEAFVDELIDEEAHLSMEMGRFEFKQRKNGKPSRTQARRAGWAPDREGGAEEEDGSRGQEG